MDGTFAVAPRLFHQLYVVQGKCNGVFLPLAYALLQRHSPEGTKNKTPKLGIYNIYSTISLIVNLMTCNITNNID